MRRDLLLLLQRGLSADQLKLVTVDGNAGLISALGHLLPGVTIQRCIVHKIRNIVGKCPRSLRGIVPAEARLIFYATPDFVGEARERFNEFKTRWQNSYPKSLNVLKKTWINSLRSISSRIDIGRKSVPPMSLNEHLKSLNDASK